MLHLNNKPCRVEPKVGQTIIALTIARRHDQRMDQAHALALRWSEVESSPIRSTIRLDAEGPFGTTDYQVELTATPTGLDSTTISFTYGCRFGSAARVVLRSYLPTLGRDKVGFTKMNTRNGHELVRGLRGAIERTAVRHDLAIEAWRDAATLPASNAPWRGWKGSTTPQNATAASCASKANRSTSLTNVMN